MKMILKAVILLLVLSTVVYATTGFLAGERISGMNKICYYDVLGSTYTLNIGATELCPLSYEF